MTCQLAIAEQENKEVDPEKKQIAYILNPCLAGASLCARKLSGFNRRVLI
jgi:hypothetical protein